MRRIIDFARAQVGKPYLFGTSGPNTFDCSGLTLRAVKLLGYNWYHGATTQWNRGLEQKAHNNIYGYWTASGPIETMPTDKVLFLFNQDKTKAKLTMAHTGIYDGQGNVVQAGGQYPGVSNKPINRKRWSHWAMIQESGEHKMTWQIGSTGETVKRIQRLLMQNGFSLPKFGADGKFGAETELAVKGFQRNNNLEPTGTVDEALLAMLDSKPPVDGVVTLSRDLAQRLYDALKLQI